MFKTRVVHADVDECQSLRQVRMHTMNVFSIFFKIKVCCMLLFESLCLGDLNKNTQYTIFNIRKKITPNYLKSVVMVFFP